MNFLFTKQVTEILANAGNYEERRSQEIFIKSGIKPIDRRTTTTGNTEVGKIADAISERKQTQSLWNALNEIP